MKKYIFVFCCTLIFYTCEETTTTSSDTNNTPITSQSATGTSPKTSAAVLSQDQLESLGQTMAFSTFNERIKQANKSVQEWTSSPLLVALKFAGLGMESRVKSVRAESLSGGESFDKVLVTIEEDGLLDDSIQGTMTILRMEVSEGLWQIRKATRVWKCWKGRGAEEYGGEPCS